MADRPTADRGREDTVAIPRPPTSAPPGDSDSGKVMPPMPSDHNGASSNGVATPSKGAPRTPARGSRPTKVGRSRQARAATSAPAAPPPPAPELDADRPTAPAAPTAPVRAAEPTREQRRARGAQVAPAAPKSGRRARLRLSRIDPWSVMKTAFLLSIALGIVTVVSVIMVWSVLGAADVWSSIDKTVRDVLGSTDSNFRVEDYIGTRRVVGFTIIVAAVDVVLVTAICTLGAFLYNMSASLLGGIEVTLAEDN